METNSNPSSETKSSSDDYYLSTTTTNDNDRYGYNPLFFHFNDDLIQQRYTKYRLQQKLNIFAFWFIGIFYLATSWIVTQWRGINGSLGFLWMCQSIACIVCVFVFYPLCIIIEFRRRWIDCLCEIFSPTANIRQIVTSLRVSIFSAFVVIHAFTHLALVGRSYKLCSTADMQSTFDLCYCNSSMTEIPYENFFSMIVLNILYHYIFLHLLPWGIPVSSYVIGMIWTLMTIAHKRIHMEAIGK